MTRDEFLDLICFCILMENNEGILGKAPSYVIEKFQDRDVHLLDYINKAKYDRYFETWFNSIQGLPEE